MDASTVRRWIEEAAASLRQDRDYLTQLDAAIGDADHGANMDRGFTALVTSLESLDETAGPGALLVSAGDTLTAMGGASGALWGTAFRRAGKALGDAPEFQCEQLATALEEALDGIVDLGTASEGDKTMVDALAPAARALRERAVAGASPADALAATREAGAQGMRATIPLQAHKGRASYLGERSIGHQDPGATSAVLILAALEQAVAAES
jgi:phosphoenolpyruvate---glycerone phosphotransferase subunit DhaL